MSAGHEVLLASAGTGKTHELSRRLLALLFDGVDPRTLLATTFTRKAAGEIAERLLERLLHGVRDADKRAELPGPGGAAPSEADCARLLLDLLRRGDELRIETLDAFFGRLAQAFAGELGLPPEWRLADQAEDARLRERVLARVLAEGADDELHELLRALRGGGAEGERATHERLQRELGAGYELWLDAAPDAFDPADPPGRVDDAARERLAAELEAASLPVSEKTGKPNGHFDKARAAMLAALADDDWAALVEKGLGAPLLADAEAPTYYRLPFPDDLRDAVHAVVRAALAELRAELAHRTRAHGALLARFHAAYVDAKQAAGVVRFDDLPRALDAAGELPAALLLHRTESRPRHLLLDEFQDTAPLQWRVFERLAAPLLEDRAHSTLVCVGDLKQSLYAFRGGEARLLEDLAERLSLTKETLTKNWRSAPALLDFVQRVFGGLDRVGFFAEPPGLERARATWQRRWTPPEAALTQLQSEVVVHRVRVDDATAEERRELLARFTARRVAALQRAEPGKRVGVLLRTNKPVARMLQALRAEGVAAGGAGGAPLTDSAAVRLILSALRFAEHPGDGLARLHLELTPFGRALGVDDVFASAPHDTARADADADSATQADTSAGDPRDTDAARDTAHDAWAARLRARWASLGTAGLLEELRTTLEACTPTSAWDRVRLGQLVEIGERHDELPDLRLADFLHRVETEGVPHPAAEGVQVLTIHASKGLAFDTVLLPELDGESFKQRSSPLVARPDPFAPLTRAWLGGRSGWMQHDAELGELLHDATEGSAEGDLCSLYVALTRARTRLELLLPEPLPSRTPRCFAALLDAAVDLAEWELPAHEALDDDAADTDAPDGAADSRDAAAADSTRADNAPGEALAHASATPHAGERAALAAETSRDGEHAAPAAPSAHAVTWDALPEAPRRRGLLWHHWCEHVAWLEADAAPPFDAARAAELGRAALLAADAAPDDASGDPDEHLDLADEWRRFAAALAAPDIAAALRAPADTPLERAPELWRERPFVARDAAGAVTQGRFDRVHVTRDADGRAASAEVLDFKTGRAPDAQSTDAADHRAQIQRYRDALAAILELPRDAVTGALLYLGDGRVTRVDD